MNDEDKRKYVESKFLKCMVDFDIFKAGESYWLEYIGNDTYVGRSDNILNKKIVIEPYKLDYFIEPILIDKEKYIKELSEWFYHIRTDGMKPDTDNDKYCIRQAILYFKNQKTRLYNLADEYVDTYIDNEYLSGLKYTEELVRSLIYDAYSGGYEDALRDAFLILKQFKEFDGMSFEAFEKEFMK